MSNDLENVVVLKLDFLEDWKIYPHTLWDRELALTHWASHRRKCDEEWESRMVLMVESQHFNTRRVQMMAWCVSLPGRGGVRRLESRERTRLASQPSCVSCSVVSSSSTPWTVAHQAPRSMEWSRQEILEWVAIPFSRGSFWPRDRAWVSCIAGRFFIVWTTKETLSH